MAKKCEIILEEVSMESLCNFYGLTQYRGRKYVCPFHADKNPSASISKDNKWFRCFGCGVSVNTINFVCKYENCDKHTAITKLDTMFSLGLGRITWKEKQEIEKAKQLRKQKELEEEQFKNDSRKILNYIARQINRWEECEQQTHLTQLEYLSGKWKYADLYFYSLQQQKWLNWLYQKLCDISHEECEYDYIYQNETAESLMKKILNKEISILK